MTNQLASLAQRDYFYLDPFLECKSRYVYNKLNYVVFYNVGS